MIKQTLLHAFIFTLAITAFSQSSYLDQNTSPGVGLATDINGRPLYLKTEYVADGSPYLYEEYCLAEIISMNGTVYKNVKAKINLLEKQLLYMIDNGMEMIVTTPVKRIKFFNYISNGVAYPERVFESHLTALNAEGAPIYEVLAEDSAATLLKQTVVTFSDSKGYGEATITRTFKRREIYFAVIPTQSNQLVKIERDKKAIVALFGSRAIDVDAYIKRTKLRCRTDNDLVEIFHFYQSL